MGKKIDLTGEKYGKWTVLHPKKREIGSPGKLTWICECECGTEIELGSNYIRNYWNSTDCGCSKTLVGKRFGKLLVIERLGKDVRYVSNYVCQCDCGRVKTYRGNYLIYEKVISCGCGRRKNTKQNGQTVVWYTYKKHAKKRNLEFSLTREEFELLINEKCFYCGKEETNKTLAYKKHITDAEIYRHNGIDRLQNSKGYTKENAVPCCKLCNHMKWNLTVEEWKNHIQLVLESLNKTALVG